MSRYAPDRMSLSRSIRPGGVGKDEGGWMGHVCVYVCVAKGW